MTPALAIPYAVMIASFVAFGGAMSLFRFAARSTASKRLLVVSIYACAAAQFGALWWSPPTSAVLPWIAVGLFALAQGVFWWSLACHGPERPGFAFIEVEPSVLTVRGPYRVVRHPIYASYLIAWVGGVVLAGQPWLTLTAIWMGFLYYRAASREERAFLSSPLAPSYASYRRRAGMFLPRVRTLVNPRG